jgi:hypothetical protein
VEYRSRSKVDAQRSEAPMSVVVAKFVRTYFPRLHALGHAAKLAHQLYELQTQ